MKLAWEEDAWSDYLDWQTDKKTFKKINKLIKEIMRTPYNGSGKPEQLKGNLAGLWSRRIDQKNRILYRVVENEVQIVAVGSHYNEH